MTTIPFLRLFFILFVRTDPYQTIEHSIGAQVDMLYSFVVYAH